MTITSNLKPPTKDTDIHGCTRVSEKWDFREKKCVPRTFTPTPESGNIGKVGSRVAEIGNTLFSTFNCPPGQYWKPGVGCTSYSTEDSSATKGLYGGYGTLQECINSGKSPGECITSVDTSDTSNEPNPDEPQWKEACEAKGKVWDSVNKTCTDATPKEPEQHTNLQECIKAGLGAQKCNQIYGNDTGEYLPPIDDATKTPSPFDNREYYNWLVSPSGEMSQEELAYWDTQQKVITQTFEEGWNDIEAQISAMGGAYGSEINEIQAIYTRDLETALRGAYNEIMYTGLQRRFEEKKAAMDFYTNNKSLELSYAIANGQLTVEMLKTYINADVAYAGIEVDMLRAITENALARVTSDVQIETLRQNWLLIAMQLGMSNDAAEDAWGQILGSYGAGQTSKITM